MTWERLRELPPTVLYEDEYGNVRRRSVTTGRFISGSYPPAYGRGGYGDTVTLSADLTDGGDE